MSPTPHDNTVSGAEGLAIREGGENVGVPDFPLFEMGDAEAAFGCERHRYLPTKQEGRRVERLLRAEADAADRLFFLGGSLAQYGFRVRDGFDSKAVHRNIRGLLSSWDCSQEQKTGTTALAIHHWCEPLSPEAASVQS